MTTQTEERERLQLTQTEAARQAGVSLATWRRWEENPDSVTARSRVKCESALMAPLDRAVKHAKTMSEEWADSDGAFLAGWKDSRVMSPRQAKAIVYVLSSWGDTSTPFWLNGQDEMPLCFASGFSNLDLRVMMLVGDNKAWAASFAERCLAVAKEMHGGHLPMEHLDCFMDEVLIGLALSDAQDFLENTADHGMFDGLPASLLPVGPTDDDWDSVEEELHDQVNYTDWRVPSVAGPELVALLETRHPFTWFDVPASWTSEA